MSEIRNNIIEQSSHFDHDDIIPLPCNPESIAIGYALRNAGRITPVTSLIPKHEYLSTAPNTVSFEKDPDRLNPQKEVVYLLQLSQGPYCSFLFA